MARLILILSFLIVSANATNMCNYYVNGLQKSYKDYQKALSNQLYSSINLILYQMEFSAKNVVLECNNKTYIKIAKDTLKLTREMKGIK